MIFRLMLFGFGLVMKAGFIFTSLKDRSFKGRIQDKKFIMQIKMRDENKGRYYKLENGKITSRGKIAPESPGVLIEWKDSPTALKTILKTDLKRLFNSIANSIVSGNLSVEVEYAQTYDFVDTLIDMAKVYSGFLPMLKKTPGVKKILTMA